MKIATWNVNSIRSRLTHLQAWLMDNRVDVLCLQETKVVDTDFPRQALEASGYCCAFSGQKSYNGVAILTRQPLEKVWIGFTPLLGPGPAERFDQQKRVIAGTYQGVMVINLYVPNGAAIGSEKYDYKLAWLAQLKQYLTTLQAQSHLDLCLCGDFNIALEDRDIYDPKGKATHIMASPVERQALQAILALGLQDVFRHLNPEPGHFSWWDYRTGGFQRNRGWRIDHIYLTPGLLAQAKSCRIDKAPRAWDKPSDHTPVLLELED